METNYEFCSKCGKKTSLMCQQCSKAYCSKRCQESDWKAHKYVCFSSPFIIRNLMQGICMHAKKANSTNDDTSQTDPVEEAEGNESSNVAPAEICTIDMLLQFPISIGDYISLIVLDANTIFKGFITVAEVTDKSIAKQIRMNAKSVASYARSQQAIEGRGYEPKENEIVLALYSGDHEWYRAVCLNPLNPSTEKALVKFIDYGNVAMVRKDNISPIPQHLMFPIRANICYIEGLDVREYRKFFKRVTAKPFLKGKVSNRDDGACIFKPSEMVSDYESK